MTDKPANDNPTWTWPTIDGRKLTTAQMVREMRQSDDPWDRRLIEAALAVDKP